MRLRFLRFCLLGGLCLILAGCTLYADRGPIMDPIAKDYEPVPFGFVTTTDGERYYGELSILPNGVRVRTPDGRTLSFPDDRVASVEEEAGERFALDPITKEKPAERFPGGFPANPAGIQGLASLELFGPGRDSEQEDAPHGHETMVEGLEAPGGEYKVLSVPLPIFATDPNSGPLLGFLPVLVFQEADRSRITDIFAPSIEWNAITGLGLVFRMRRFFDRYKFMSLDLAATTEGQHDYDFAYEDLALPPGNLFLRVAGRYSELLTKRHWGVGNDTIEENETTYKQRAQTAELTLGAFLPYDFEISFGEHFRRQGLGTGRGVVDDLPSLVQLFPGTRGIRENLTAVSTRVDLTYDTRNSPTAPTSGLYVNLFYEISNKSFGSEYHFQKFGIEAIGLIPIVEDRFTMVLRFNGLFVDGKNLPFWELSEVGGKTSVRGFGEGRFVDNHRIVFNAEGRWTFVDFELMDVLCRLQLAGFIDVGRVYALEEEFEPTDFKVAAGGAIRLVVPDSELVTSIDLGFSEEGPAVFVGLGYPF